MKAKLFFLISICLLMSCASEPTITTFTPPQESPLRITFQYPSNWEWYYEPPKDKVKDISMGDPYYQENADRGMLEIFIIVTNSPQEDMSASIKQYKKTTRNLEPYAEILSEEQITIGNYPAERFVRRVTANYRLGEKLDHYSETWFLLSEDGFYIIYFTIPITEIDGRFHQEFKAMVESIQFLP